MNMNTITECRCDIEQKLRFKYRRDVYITTNMVDYGLVEIKMEYSYYQYSEVVHTQESYQYLDWFRTEIEHHFEQALCEFIDNEYFIDQNIGKDKNKAILFYKDVNENVRSYCQSLLRGEIR